MSPKIIAGSVKDICKESGQWMIVDLGFSKNNPTCGVWTDANIGEPEVVTFEVLVDRVVQEACENKPPSLNLLLEAPLSVAFAGKYNPTRRRCDERRREKNLEYRDWYYNAGAATLIAAGHLLRALDSCQRQRNVKLFEGFVSFKRSKPENKAEAEKRHKKDVQALKNVVWDPTTACFVTLEKIKQSNGTPDWDSAVACIFDPQALNRKGERVVSAFAFAGMDFGVPPVVRIVPQQAG